MAAPDVQLGHRVRGWRCAVCGATRPVAATAPWRCPNASPEDRHHVLHPVSAPGPPAPAAGGSTLLAHDRDLAWAAYAAAHGVDEGGRRLLVQRLESAVREVDGDVDAEIGAEIDGDVAGAGFAPTPFARDDTVSAALGFSGRGGVWIKDETGAVAGSQKARHLVTILLHLSVAESLGRLPPGSPLAIASCGNAALAAATLARADGRSLDVYVPTWMGAEVGERLAALGARIHRCERRAGDPPGDPAMHRFREAVAEGAVPFTVQGPENALCLDGGRTIGWEAGEQFARDRSTARGSRPDRVFVQVGGGAFAACLGTGLHDVVGPVRFHPVQVEGCAPLARAWRRAGLPTLVAASSFDLDDLASRWAELMTPWDSPDSAADGILDDETYDWLGVLAAVRRGGGGPVVASESDVLEAHDLAREAGFRASPTGSAGLAGLLAVRDTIGPDERVVVVLSGVARVG